MMHKSSITVAATLFASASAFWRMECPGRVSLGRIDPIVNPGELSSHVHTAHGSSAFSESATTDSLLDGNCTSCRVTQDKSNYWTPALYFEDKKTGHYELVGQAGGMLAYYLLYGENIKAYPSGFKMIAGSNFRRNYTLGDYTKPDPPKSNWAALDQTKQSDLAQRAIGFNCLNYDKTPEGTLYRHYLPNKEYLDANCKDGVRFELMFPSCWNGKDIASKTQDHVAYPDLVMTGTCPEGYETQLPSMLFETIWNTNEFAGRDGQFVIANGDVTGFGYHGDFMMGWEESFLQSAVNKCTNPSGLIEDCPLFNVVDEGTATSCKGELPVPLLNENVLGPRSGLPGGVKITYGNTPGNGGSSAAPGGASSSQPALSYQPGEQPTDKASPLPGQVFKEKESSGFAAAAVSTSASSQVNAQALSSSAAPTTTSTTTTTTAPPPPPPTTTSTAPTETYSYYSTQYVTSGNVISKILWEEELQTVTEMIEATSTVWASATKRAVPDSQHRRRVAHAHAHGHHHA